jgi:DNA-binding protein HU-beta
MNRSALIEQVQKELGDGATKAEAQRAVDAVLTGISRGLTKRGEGVVQLVGFGTFRVVKRAARKGRNPQTGEEIKIKASKSVSFKPGKALKDKL